METTDALRILADDQLLVPALQADALCLSFGICPPPTDAFLVWDSTQDAYLFYEIIAEGAGEAISTLDLSAHVFYELHLRLPRGEHEDRSTRAKRRALLLSHIFPLVQAA